MFGIKSLVREEMFSTWCRNKLLGSRKAKVTLKLTDIFNVMEVHHSIF